MSTHVQGCLFDGRLVSEVVDGVDDGAQRPLVGLLLMSADAATVSGCSFREHRWASVVLRGDFKADKWTVGRCVLVGNSYIGEIPTPEDDVTLNGGPRGHVWHCPHFGNWKPAGSGGPACNLDYDAVFRANAD